MEPLLCEQCRKPLDDKKVVWLELNRDTLIYDRPGIVPPELSQGEFPFGAACARRVVSFGFDQARRDRAERQLKRKSR